MKIGTKSLLFGVHAFYVHPFFVALAWWKLYGFPYDPRLWVAFFLHDIGYWGKPNMDGKEGELHPHLGADMMMILFDDFSLNSFDEGYKKWRNFTLYHSRYLAKKHGVKYSQLCVADKLVIAIMPRWFYLLQVNLSGEIHEYMKGQAARTPANGRSQWEWITDLQKYMRGWVEEHKDMRADTWTGTERDKAI